MAQSDGTLNIVEATIDEIHDAYRSGRLTCRQLVQGYLDRIAAFDKKGPAINALITVNPDALTEADRLDAAYKTSGTVGPLHGITVIVKDQADVKGMPTTLGSVLFKDYYPDRDSFVAEKLRNAGAVILGKATLGELGGGDTHGSLFGSTRNPYDTERTVGGSSGGSGASVSANFSTVGVGQEGLASIRRPSTWNGIAGMRPSAGLVSRSGVYGCWPEIFGSLGPMARTVKDLATLLDVMVGYDPEDPITARGVSHIPDSFTKFLDKNGLKGMRLGVLRESIGLNAEPDSADFKKVSEVFDKAVAELKAAGAEIVDPIVIPKIKELLGKRSGGPGDTERSFKNYFGRSANPPYKTPQEVIASPNFTKVVKRSQERFKRNPSPEQHYESLRAQDELMTAFLKVMADHKLDAIVHKAVEHQPTLIKDGIAPPFVDQKGAPHLNTFLVYVPTIVVPAGFTRDNLPAGLCFIGRPYDDGNLIKFAYAYEQATRHRRPPASTTAL
ncbi:MAG TPA: amidase family protein [Terriglobales bacterium]|jgi:Asp-tRNA(Asn)/Glu-tRNA(Gln) amidotransferase A subunit family amidase|nr:amidase family protein [Terriglobales bacterium]